MKGKIKEWVERYLFADILSTLLSLGTAWGIDLAAGDRVMAAFAGSAMASVSFYGIIAWKDLRQGRKHHGEHDPVCGFTAYCRELRNLIIEFGPSEILDVLAVRPFFMYLMPKVTGEFVLGTFIGKMMADVVFFIPAIVMYEVRKRHL